MDESSKETSCLASHGHGHGHGCGHGHGANRGRGCGHGVLLTKESSFRTQMLQEYNDELIQDSIHFAEIDSHANWQKAKEKIQPVKQQSIRESCIEKKINEKKELIETVTEAEREKKEAALLGLTFQAVQLAFLNKAVKMLDDSDEEGGEVQELKSDMVTIREQLGQVSSEVKEIKEALTQLLQRFSQ